MAQILIVDDHPDSCDLLTRVLAQQGHVIRCASGGREGLTSLLNNMPDLLVLDLLMPEMDGVSLLEVLRSYLRLAKLPVVVLTGFPDGPSAKRARELGVRHVLAKATYDLNEISKAVGEALAAY